MITTKMKAGRLVAAYVDDALGRRLVIGDSRERKFGQAIDSVLVAATTQAEARELVATIRQLAEELPPGAPEAT